MIPFEELAIEVHCDNCNSTISGKRGYLICPCCGKVNSYIRVLLEKDEKDEKDEK